MLTYSLDGNLNAKIYETLQQRVTIALHKENKNGWHEYKILAIDGKKLPELVGCETVYDYKDRHLVNAVLQKHQERYKQEKAALKSTPLASTLPPISGNVLSKNIEKKEPTTRINGRFKGCCCYLYV